MAEEGETDGANGNVVRLAQYFSEPQEIAAVVAELREIERKAGLERVVAIGHLVLHRFFGGLPEVWRERRRNKNNSVRRIAEHPDCPLSRSALNEAIAVYVAVQTHPCARTFGHITASHLAAVTMLPTDHQREWLERAEQAHWSVRQLRERLRTGRLESGERRGRPPALPEQRLVAGVRGAVGALRRAIERLSRGRRAGEDQGQLTSLADELVLLAEKLRVDTRALRSEPCAAAQSVVKAQAHESVLESAG